MSHLRAVAKTSPNSFGTWPDGSIGGNRKAQRGQLRPLLAVPTPSTEEDTMFEDQRIELLPERTTLKGWKGGRKGGGGNITVNVLIIKNSFNNNSVGGNLNQ